MPSKILLESLRIEIGAAAAQNQGLEEDLRFRPRSSNSSHRSTRDTSRKAPKLNNHVRQSSPPPSCDPARRRRCAGTGSGDARAPLRVEPREGRERPAHLGARTTTEMIFRDTPIFFQGQVQMYPAPTTGAGYCSRPPAPGNASSGAGDGTTRP